MAVELARALPREWIAGRCRPGATARIHAAAEAASGSGGGALVVVDDADTEPAVDIAALIRHTVQPDTTKNRRRRVRVSLTVRDAESFTALMDEQLSPGINRTWRSQTLLGVGEAGDRCRFFTHAVHAFLGLDRDTQVPDWARPPRSRIGDDGETMVWTATRAALAVLADTPQTAVAMRTAAPADLAAEIIGQERRRWTATLTDPRWHVGPHSPRPRKKRSCSVCC